MSSVYTDEYLKKWLEEIKLKPLDSLFGNSASELIKLARLGLMLKKYESLIWKQSVDICGSNPESIELYHDWRKIEHGFERPSLPKEDV